LAVFWLAGLCLIISNFMVLIAQLFMGVLPIKYRCLVVAGRMVIRLTVLCWLCTDMEIVVNLNPLFLFLAEYSVLVGFDHCFGYAQYLGIDDFVG
jgi:hypothetical protein